MEYSGAGVKLIYEKNQKQKISWHCPFKYSWVEYMTSRSKKYYSHLHITPNYS